MHFVGRSGGMPSKANFGLILKLCFSTHFLLAEKYFRSRPKCCKFIFGWFCSDFKGVSTVAPSRSSELQGIYAVTGIVWKLSEYAEIKKKEVIVKYPRENYA